MVEFASTWPLLLSADLDSIADVPILSYQAAFEGFEGLHLFRVQNPHVNSPEGE